MDKKYKAVVMGASAGGLFALTALFERLPADYPAPIIVVQHRSKDMQDLLEQVLQSKSAIKIKQADEKEGIRNGIVYIAPPDYHLLVEGDHTFSLSCDEAVNYSRPSIDVLFESAAAVYKESLVGILLTGASRDGAEGLLKIKKQGGLTIAQTPDEAQYPLMPAAAIERGAARLILPLGEIRQQLLNHII